MTKREQPALRAVNTDQSKTISSVGSTVEAFADRMKRKLKEQESLNDESRKAEGERHQQMLQSLTTIRKALVETSRITLGDRFHFELEISDWEGWPKLELNLIDDLYPEMISQALIVTAHDRNALGLVQMALKSGEIAGRILLSEPGEFEKLPVVLKRAIRHFLDCSTPIILNPAPPPEKKTIENKQLFPESAEEAEAAKKLSKTDLFVGDEELGSDNVAESDDVKPIDFH